MLKLVVRANTRRDKGPVLLELREEVEELKVVPRLCQDVKAFANFDAFEQAITKAVEIAKQNASNNLATGYGGAAHFTRDDPQATLPADTTLTNGTGTFSATLRTAGNRAITGTDTVTASITGTSGVIAVIGAAAASHSEVSAPAVADAGATFSFTVTALDPCNTASRRSRRTAATFLPAAAEVFRRRTALQCPRSRNMALHERYEAILAAVLDATREQYGPRLVALAVYGSVGRGTMREDSDVDLLLVALDPAPRPLRAGAAVEFRGGPRRPAASARGAGRRSHRAVAGVQDPRGAGGRRPPAIST